MQTGAALVRAGQVVVQRPQCVGSVARFTQAPLHAVRGEAHVAVHTPEEHTWPAPHGVPQPPQLALSVRMFTSQPFDGLASQSRCPVVHEPTAQAPPTQVAVANDSEQARPQAPQFAAVVLRFVSQPLAAMASQLPRPALHVSTVQAPPLQPFVAAPESAHTRLQTPQFSGSDERFAQYADDAAPQVLSGLAQVAVHTPAEHTWPAEHDTPHAPQLLRSVRVLTSQPSAAMPSQSR